MDIVSYVIGRASAVGGSSGGSSGEIKRYEGSFEVTGKIQTIEHNIGEVPDIFILKIGKVPTSGTTFLSIGYSQAMYDKVGENLSKTYFIAPNGGSVNIGSPKGIEFSNESVAMYGVLRNATSQTIDAGGDSYGLEVGAYYQWEALCGIV